MLGNEGNNLDSMLTFGYTYIPRVDNLYDEVLESVEVFLQEIISNEELPSELRDKAITLQRKLK